MCDIIQFGRVNARERRKSRGLRVSHLGEHILSHIRDVLEKLPDSS
jgi:hypothetical protein